MSLVDHFHIHCQTKLYIFRFNFSHWSSDKRHLLIQFFLTTKTASTTATVVKLNNREFKCVAKCSHIIHYALYIHIPCSLCTDTLLSYLSVCFPFVIFFYIGNRNIGKHVIKRKYPWKQYTFCSFNDRTFTVQFYCFAFVLECFTSNKHISHAKRNKMKMKWLEIWTN